jgi:hypothetical protein
MKIPQVPAEIYTHELDSPSQSGCLQILVVGERAAFDNFHRVHNGEPTIQFTAWDVVVNVLMHD